MVRYKGSLYQAESSGKARPVIAQVELHAGALFPRVGFIVTNLETDSGAVVHFCQEPDSAGGRQSREMARLIGSLMDAMQRPQEILTAAERSGMEVSEALLRQREAQENLVKARVAVHAFRVAAVAEPIEEGRKIVAETFQAGERALRERDSRRLGLAVSLVAILITIAGLWLAIRTIEAKFQGAAEPTGR